MRSLLYIGQQPKNTGENCPLYKCIFCGDETSQNKGSCICKESVEFLTMPESEATAFKELHQKFFVAKFGKKNIQVFSDKDAYMLFVAVNVERLKLERERQENQARVDRIRYEEYRIASELRHKEYIESERLRSIKSKEVLVASSIKELLSYLVHFIDKCQSTGNYGEVPTEENFKEYANMEEVIAYVTSEYLE